ncbi:MAG: S-layer homology domain-containing protein [Oscillospiraceae bacterium]|jgi:hypothetical protein|nr:S-layer homology domain-containing protein [Oscillospiraceae bacterium]
MKRKILSTILIAAALIIGIVTVNATGAETNTIQVVLSAGNVKRGDTFTAQVSFAADAGVSSIEFDLGYDAGIRLDSAAVNAAYLNVLYLPGLPNPLHVSCGPKGIDAPSGDNIFLLSFSVLESAEFGNKNIALSNIIATNSDDQQVTLSPRNATVAVEAKASVSPGLSDAAVARPYSGAAVALPVLTTGGIAADGTPVTSVKAYSDAARTAEIDAAAVKNAGTYYVRGYYEDTTQQGTADGTITITQVQLSLTGVAAADRTYDKTPNVALSGGKLSGAVNGEAPTFALGAGTADSADVGGGKPVAYTAALTGNWGMNYMIADKNAVTVSIAAATPTYAIDAARNIKVGSELGAFTAIAPENGTGVGGESVAGAAAWYSDSGYSAPARESDVSNAEISDTVALYWTFTPASANYAELTGQTVFTIVDGDPQPLEFADGGECSATYGGGAYTNDLTGAYGAVAYASGNEDVALVDGSGIVTIVGAGSARITATASAVPGEWAESMAGYTLSVVKKTPELSDLVFYIPSGDIYSGTAQGMGGVSANIAPLTGFGAIAVKYSGSEAVPTDAGTYTVTADIAEGANYAAASLALGEYTIEKMPIDGAAIGGIENSYLYTGTEIAPEPSVELPGFAPARGGDYTVSFADNTGAGGATVTITGTGNFSGEKTVEFTIRPFVTGVALAAAAGTNAPEPRNESKVAVDIAETPGGYAVTVTKRYGETLAAYLSDDEAEAEGGAQPYVGLVFELDPGGDGIAQTDRFVLWYKYGADKSFALASGGATIAVTVRSFDEPATAVPPPSGGGGGGGSSPTPTPTPEPEPDTDIADPLTPGTDAPDISAPALPFTDVRESDWFYGDVEYAYINGLMTGTSATAFSPNTAMTRAMLVTVLYRLAVGDAALGVPNPGFDDVPPGQWYTDAVAWAHSAGIVSGIGDNRFAPDAEIARQDMAVMLARYAGAMEAELPATRAAAAFADGGDVAGYAKDAVDALYSAGVVGGKPGNLFDPRGPATRAEVAAMLHRFILAAE